MRVWYWMKQIRGMTDLCMYELEDIAWDEFDQIDDHIVPHEHGSEPAFQRDNCKKPRLEVIGISNSVGDGFTSKYVSQGNGGEFHSLKNRSTKVLEKDLWSHPAEGVLPASQNSASSKEATSLASDVTRMNNHCFKTSNMDTMGTQLCADDTRTDERSTGNESNSCPYSLGDISQTNNDLSFLNSDPEDRESDDLMYYGWPDIENFDDVDRMFRNCDSPFGFGSSNENDLGWFSSSRTIEEPEDLLKSDFKVSCPELTPFKSVPEQEDPSKLNNAGSSVNDSSIQSVSISYKPGFQAPEIGEADPLGNLTVINGFHAISDRKDVFIPKEQIKFQKKQASRSNHTEGKRKDRYNSRQVFAYPDQKPKKNTRPDSFGYMQTPTPYMHLNYIHPSDQIPVGLKPSGIKSENDSLTSLSPKESSYASNQAQSMESSPCHLFEPPAMSGGDKREKLQRQQGFYPSSVQKHVHNSQNDANNHSEVERVNLINSADIDSSILETSCMSSGFDEISLEASSFRQLQHVMEQLDLRTKLCIRDSLYRLARSAEQRHHMSGDGDTGSVLMAEGSNTCNGFMDMETNTNPIDRSVAHLLFHRPSDPSVMPAHAASSLKSHTMEQIHGSITSPPVMAEMLACQEEAASEAEKKLPMTDDG